MTDRLDDWNGVPPADATKDGWHWLCETARWSQPEPSFWYAGLQTWRGKGHASEAARLGVRYLGPCPEPPASDPPAPVWGPGTGQIIERLYAWVAREPDGGEGVVAWKTSDGWMPLIGADAERIAGYRLYAEAIARTTGLPVTLRVFTGTATLETVDGS